MDAAIKEMLQNDIWSPVVEKLGLPKGVARSMMFYENAWEGPPPRKN